MKKLKSESGFTAMDATVAIIIVSLSLVLISLIIFNTYTQALSAHKSSMATMYAVEVLEKINVLDYNDSQIAQGQINSTESILGVNIDDGYQVNVDIKDYNKQAGNTDKMDLIKIVTVTVNYNDENIAKNISIKTLKLNM